VVYDNGLKILKYPKTEERRGSSFNL